MLIGVPREVKEHEYRVSATPDSVRALVGAGHRVMVESAAGEGSGFPDEEYRHAGAEITGRSRVFQESELIIKVKEPVPSEYDLMQYGQAIFTYLHLAANPELTDILLRKQIAAFAYETLQADGKLPLLSPMSEIAGKMAPIMGAYYLQKIHGGSGILIGGTHDGPPAHVLILGAGVVGMAALDISIGMGAKVTVINRGQQKLNVIIARYGTSVRTFPAEQEHIKREVRNTDLLIGAVLVPGARTPRLVSRHLVAEMKKGSVIVDVSVDQGGCIETTRPTSHGNPVYIVDGVVHYTVANMPGAYPRTSTFALTAHTLQYIKMLADKGIEYASKDRVLQTALNTCRGRIMNEALAGS